MPRTAVVAERMTDATTADALREHREDRAALLASLTASLQADPRVSAVWFHGSFGRGEADDLSDLDLWVAVSDLAGLEADAMLCGHAALAGNLIGAKRSPDIAPPGGGFLASRHEGRYGYLGIDWSWQPQSALTLPAEVTVLIERDGQDVPMVVPHLPVVKLDRNIVESPVEGGLWFAWLMIGVTAKCLARDPQSDMALMLYPRPALEDVAALLGQQDTLLPIDWSVPEKPLDKLERLRGLARTVAEAADAARAQGHSFSPQYLPCLFRYLGMVGSILKDAASAR